MKGIKGLAFGSLVALAALGIGAGLLASQVWAATGTVSIGSATAEPGEEATVDLEAQDVTSPGLGAWTIDVIYDPSVVTAEDCTFREAEGVCNVEFDDDTVRITGAVAEGLEGDTRLGTITFACGDEEGESPLEVSIVTFADGTLGAPEDIDATVEDGTFTCEEAEVAVAPTATSEPALPGAGTGVAGGGNSMSWLIAALAAASLLALAGASALGLRRS